MFLSEDRGKIRAEDKIKKSKKKEKSKNKENFHKKAKSHKNGTCVLDCTRKLHFKTPLNRQFLMQIRCNHCSGQVATSKVYFEGA
jgi:hypothetical protein